MKTHILQHVHFEDIGSIRSWMESRQAELSYTRFFKNDSLPRLEGLDAVIVMGGPMSVHDEDACPWLRAEKQFIHDAVQRGVPVLGICLGAQLIANAMGARVYRNAHKEIGWFEVVQTSLDSSVFHLPERFLSFHWHGETFDLPAGAIHLAKSVACRNQAFQIGKHAIGLQFHLETTPESAGSLIENCRDELIPGSFVHSEEELRRAPSSAYTRINSIMNDLLSYMMGVSG